MDAIDYSEAVTLLLAGQRPEHMSLASAVRRVVSFQDVLVRSQAAITRDGTPIIRLAEIEAIYARPDFPKN